MVHINSNLASVIARFQRLPAAVETARVRALDPLVGEWHAAAHASAETILRTLAGTDAEREAVPRFLATIEALAVSPGLLRLAMQAPQGEAESVRGRVGRQLQANQPTDPAELLTAVTEWVEVEKHMTAEDLRNPDEVAAFITFLLGASSSGLIGGRAPARDSLRGAVVGWLTTQVGGLPVETINTWLLAVLGVWKETVKAHFPAIFRRELVASWTV